MSLMVELPEIDNKKLVACTPSELIEIMIEHEDRVPRNVIDECARRGEQMLDALAPIAQAKHELENEIPGHWWLRLHAVMILGLIPGGSAGHTLVAFIHGMCEEEDENLQEWFSGYWPALLRNKPPSVNGLLKGICEDKNTDWFMRANVTEAVIAHASQQGEAALNSTLDWAAQFAADEQEDWDYRLSTANDLLDYPRNRHRDLITELADRQSGMGVHFNRKDINKAYAHGTDAPKLERFNDPWQFYEPGRIEKRQRRWQEEDQLQEEDDKGLDDFSLSDSDDHFPEPWQRDTPKVGRNDPCSCGSGKKYKKCCLN